jgi:hypothetical protein
VFRAWLFRAALTALHSGPSIFAPEVMAQGASQPSSQAVRVPKIWDAKKLAEWATPLAGLNLRPSFYSEEEYYATPIDNLRTYPVYHPDYQPKGYLESLKALGPRSLIEPEKLVTERDWLEAGRRVFDELDIVQFRTGDAKAIAWIQDARALKQGSPVMTKDGQFPFFRWVVTKQGKLKLSMANCTSCHVRVLKDGTMLRGAPSNLLQGNGPALEAVLAGDEDNAPSAAPKRTAGERLYQECGVPWVNDDVHARFKTMSDAEMAPFEDVTGDTIGTFQRFNGSPYYINKFADLIGVKERKYLDATATHRNREPADIARYGILVQFADDGSVGPHRFYTDQERRLTTRPPDEAMYALGLYIYSLEYPPNPNPFNELAERGQKVFEAEGCSECHTPPLYTNNKLVAAPGFEPPADAERLGLDVSKRRVGTDPGLATKTRKGTGYYKIPTLRGVWYRGLYEHSGSVASLEDWFDPKRLRQDYVPSGWKGGPGVKTRAVPGHQFGHDLPDDEKMALIAFLRTL